jgi:5-methyltetrahydrofolate--homocysteine methyltransferase
MSAFLKALRSGRVMLMDGAMGTELQRSRLKSGENSATWNELNPESVRAIHQRYLDAGAEVLLSNTFLIYAYSYNWTLAAVDRTRTFPTDWEAALDVMPAGNFYRLAAIGPMTGDAGPREFDRLGRLVHIPTPGKAFCFNEPARPERTTDAVLLETCSSPRVGYAARFLVRRNINPVLLSLAFHRNAKGKLVTASGHSPEWFARRAGDYGIAALGVNCGKDIGMDEIIEIVRRYREVTDLPLFARPNAGTPTKKGKRWVYPLTPKKMATRLPELLEAGVCMVGGCCGTRPAHIAAMRPVVNAWNARPK